MTKADAYLHPLLGLYNKKFRKHLHWLPTCHRQVGSQSFEPVTEYKKEAAKWQLLFYGAGDEARTRYLHLGKVALYQMSYTRMNKMYYSKNLGFVNPFFHKFAKIVTCRNGLPRPVCAPVSE